MIKDSIDIQSPFAKKRREFIARHKNSRPDSIYIQKRAFDRRGILERETWQLDNGHEVIDLDDAQYISKDYAEELKMQALEPSALMKLAKKQDYFGDNGIVCVLHHGEIFYSSMIVEIEPPLKEDFEPEYDISQDLEDFKRP